MSAQLNLLPPIYVDLDDVVGESMRAFIRLADRMFARRLTFEQVRSFDLAISFQLNPDEYRRFMHAAHLPDVLLDDVQPIFEALDALADWSQAGAHITVVTGRPISTYDITLAWLIRHRVPFHTLRFVRKYGRNEVATTTRQPLNLRTLSKASFRFVVEDSSKMATFLVERLNIPVILLSKPWNTGRLSVENSPLLHRCASWEEARARGLLLLNDDRYLIPNEHDYRFQAKAS